MVKVINNYTLIQKIGEGNFSEVYRAINTKKMGQFAVKIIPVEKYQESNQLEQCTINQINTLTTIASCQYIIRYEDHFQTRNNYYFVYQYCNGGNLHQVLKRQGAFSQKKALQTFRQLLEAFKVLNRYNIMHRDIKPQNIFFSNGKVKLGDFGFCKGLKPGEHMAKTMLGSPIYMAPQVLRGQNYSMKADIWSLGVVLYEMLFGVCPYQSKSIAMLISHINTKEVSMPTDFHPISQKTEQLVRKLLTKDYFRRISWIELFAYKIDEEGNFVDAESGPKTPYSSNKSFSSIRDQGDIKAIDRSIGSTRKKYDSVTREPARKFYSEKYMNLVSHPVINSTSNGTQRKISIFNDNVLQKKEDQSKSSQYKGKQPSKDALKISEVDLKRRNLLSQHQECLVILKEALKKLENKNKQSLADVYLSLVKIQHKLKSITEDINVSQTDLLDLASLVNYQVIQIDRQLIQTKQEILRRKMNIPSIPANLHNQKILLENRFKLKTSKSLDETPEVRDFWALCTTEDN